MTAAAPPCLRPSALITSLAANEKKKKKLIVCLITFTTLFVLAVASEL